MKQQQWTDDGVLEGSTHDLARVHPLLGQDMSAGRLYGKIVYSNTQCTGCNASGSL